MVGTILPSLSSRASLDRYVGIPFVDIGFSERGCHCWGLVWLIYTRELDIDLPTYGEISARDLAAISETIGEQVRVGPWRMASPARAFDVALMTGRDLDGHRARLHVGVMVDGDRVLHVERRTSAVIIPRDHPSIRHRILGVYRHSALLS